jgi:hypothetical protein
MTLPIIPLTISESLPLMTHMTLAPTRSDTTGPADILASVVRPTFSHCLRTSAATFLTAYSLTSSSYEM